MSKLTINNEFIEKIQTETNIERLVFLIRSISNYKDSKTENILLGFLEHKDSEVREEAVETLAKYNSTKVIKSLKEAMWDESYSVRTAAASSLSKIIGIRSMLQELRGMASHAQPIYRQVAAESLGTIKTVSSVKILKKMINDNHPLVKVSAAESLAILDETSSVQEMLELLEDEHYLVRVQAVETIGRVGSLDAEDSLIDILQKDKNILVRSFAAEALGEIGSKKSVKIIKEILRNEPSEDIKLAMYAALYYLGVNGTLQKLFEFLDSNSINIRCRTINILSRILNDENEAHIIDVILNQYKTERNSKVVSTIEKFFLEERQDYNQIITHKNKDITKYNKEELKFQLCKENNTTRVKQILKELSGYSDKSLVGIAQKYIVHDDGDIRYYAFIILSKQKNAKTIIALKNALSDNDPYVRNVAFGALRNFKEDDILWEEVQRLVEHGSYEDRIKGIEHLGNIDDSRSRLVLANVISDKNPKIRECVVDTLADMKCTWAEPILLNTLQNDLNDRVRGAAAISLAFLKSAKSLNLIKKQLNIEKRDLSKVGMTIALIKHGELNHVFTVTEFLNSRKATVRRETIDLLYYVVDSCNKRILIKAVLKLFKKEKVDDIRQEAIDFLTYCLND